MTLPIVPEEQPFFTIRLGRPSDHAFIVESWQSAHSQTVNGRDHGPHYVSEQKNLIRKILARANTEVRVACVPEDSDAIHGYAVLGEAWTSAPRIYYVYVKAKARRLGIARSLTSDMTGKIVTYTHRPAHLVSDKLPKQFIYSYFRNFEEV